ncbi:hypothetical protein YPPY56_4789, partial [Yersinia pestis PY-56]
MASASRTGCQLPFLPHHQSRQARKCCRADQRTHHFQHYARRGHRNRCVDLHRHYHRHHRSYWCVHVPAFW